MSEHDLEAKTADSRPIWKDWLALGVASAAVLGVGYLGGRYIQDRVYASIDPHHRTMVMQVSERFEHGVDRLNDTIARAIAQYDSSR